MKVTLLGTSAAEGWPALFCRCEACGKARILGGKNIRTRCSALLDDTLKIDFPPDILHQVLQHNLDLRCLSALVFTHAHDDHCAPAELQYRGVYFVPKPFADKLQIFGSKDTVHKIRTALSPETPDLDPAKYPLALHTLLPEKTITVSDYQVTPIRAQHDPTQDCFNLIFQDADGTTLLYATDTGWYEESTWEFLKGFRLDGIVVECTKGLQDDGYKGHLSIPEVIRFRERLIGYGAFRPESPMVTTHFSHLSGLLHEETDALLKPHNIQAGYDGMTFHISAA
ncbi:MAG TPA: MBL fold metallo-hydrolase [Chthonomonadaceae bacterium]|nr:MBL fold metallo-hydrolase [Chthonomonadaceae bacterium]